VVEGVKRDIMMTTTSVRKVSISTLTNPAMPETNINQRKKRRCLSRVAVRQLKKFAVVTAEGAAEAEEVAVIAVEIGEVATTMAAVATVVIKATAMRTVGLEARVEVHLDRSILREIKRKARRKQNRRHNRSLYSRNPLKNSRRYSAKRQSGLR
jgi:hypothetical protein